MRFASRHIELDNRQEVADSKVRNLIPKHINRSPIVQCPIRIIQGLLILVKVRQELVMVQAQKVVVISKLSWFHRLSFKCEVMNQRPARHSSSHKRFLAVMLVANVALVNACFVFKVHSESIGFGRQTVFETCLTHWFLEIAAGAENLSWYNDVVVLRAFGRQNFSHCSD